MVRMLFFHSRRPLHDVAHKLESLLRGKLWLQAIVGLALGVLFGILMGPDAGLVEPADVHTLMEWVALPGELFLRLIKMVLIPLLVASIIRGLGGTTDPEKLRKTGLAFILYIVAATVAASLIGLVMAVLIRPGMYVVSSFATGVTPVINAPTELRLLRDLPDTIISLIPVNPIASAISGEMLGIVIFSIIVGLAFAIQHNQKIEPLLVFLDGVLEVCITIVRFAMWLVPLAVFGLMARMVSQVGVATLVGVAVYVATVIAGLFLLLLLYLLLVLVFGHMSPFLFMKHSFPAGLLAFSTSSSAAVMPVTAKIAVEQLHTDEETAKVIVPLGAMFNMAGTALYQSVAILFLAQMSGIALTATQMISMALTLMVSTIGASSTPGSGMIILGSVAAGFGIPMEGFVLILGVDRILDMCRTTLNVTGDLVACVIFGNKKRIWEA